MTPNNSTIAPANPSAFGGKGYRVEQGPEWLVDALVEAPGWLAFLVVCVALVVGVGALYAASTRGVDRATKEKLVSNLLVVGSCLSAVDLSMTYLALPYVGDVAVAGLVGLGMAVYSPGFAPDLVDKWEEHRQELAGGGND